MNMQETLQMLMFDQSKVLPEDRRLVSEIGVAAYLQKKREENK